MPASFSSASTIMPIRLRPEERDLVRSILAAHVPGYTVLAFGSRVTGSAKPASDLDLCIVDDPPLPSHTLRQLQEAFSDSELPFKVDVLCWSHLSDRFRALIEASAVPLH